MSLELRPDCERCGTALPADVRGAMICSFECTFCSACVDGPLGGICPNCGGEFQPRPLRTGAALQRNPASVQHRHHG